MSDPFATKQPGLESPASSFEEVTPDDGADLSVSSRALYVGTGGDLAFTSVKGQTVTLRNLTAGWHPVRARRIFATGTTAQDIVAAW